MCPPPNPFDDTLVAALARWRITPTPEQVTKLRAHYQAMVEANREFNLTRITEPSAAAVKHYADSLALLPWLDEGGIRVESLLDIGTGPGFPAVPLAAMRPAWRVTAIDATAKKVRFVRRSAEQLGLSNLQSVHAHADHWRSDKRFDVVVLRAVAPLAECLKTATRHVARDGWIIAYKTDPLPDAELEAAVRKAKQLRLSSVNVYRYVLTWDGTDLARALLAYCHRTA